MMHIWLELLIAWAVISPVAGFFIGGYLGGLGSHTASPPEAASCPHAMSREEQHKFDAQYNPNYRGGYKVN